MAGKGFVSLGTLVADVLLQLGDEQNRRYEVKATQWILNTINRIHVNYSPYYREERLYFDNENLFTIDYPKDCVKVLSVGMYREDAFWSFTKRPDLSILATAAGGDEFNNDANEGLAVSPKGYRFGQMASNVAYWNDDPQHCRIMVRMYSYYVSTTSWEERTEWLKDKGVVVRYKSNGIDCNADVCVPAEMRALLVAKVVYEFVRRGWGIVMNATQLAMQQQEVDNLQAEYEALLYEPHNFWEVIDSIYGSFNTTARR